MALFIAQGFEETTVDQIAAEAGMSARSVFRYFDTKEDMVVGNMREVGATLVEALAARPADEGPWDALRGAIEALVLAMETDRQGALARARMFESTPALRAARQQKQAQWRDLLVPGALARVGSSPMGELRAQAIVSAILACLDVAVREWAKSDGATGIGVLLDAAITAVRE